MNIGSIVLIIVFLVVDRILSKKFPRIYKKLEFPFLILMTLIITVYCAALIDAVFDVLSSAVSVDDKVFFVGFIAIVVAIYVALAAITWRKWLKGRKKE